MTLHIGTKVKWGGPRVSEYTFDGTIRGVSNWDGTTYYVIEDDQGKFYPRPEEWVTEVPETTLPEYVSMYIKHELLACHPDYRVHTLEEELETWVANAFEAYEGGAR